MAFIEKKLSIHLKKEWFDAIKNGSKLYEIRPCTPYWTKRLSKEYDIQVENERSGLMRFFVRGLRHFG